MSFPVYVIGLGVGTPPVLDHQAQALIASADFLVGGKRLLAEFAGHPAERIEFNADFNQLLDIIRSRGKKRIVVLASGDPGFHGIAASLRQRLSDEDIRVLPNVSSLQAAFDRLAIPWHDAALTSAHAHPLEQLVGWLQRYRKIGVLTDHTNTPAHIAKTLIHAGIPDCRAVVAENLGLPSERIVDGCLFGLVDQEFAPLNVMLILQGNDWQPVDVFPYREDGAYEHQRGLITKRDIRALSIARMRIQPHYVIWDIGAGSGAMSVEMAQLAWQGQVYAIERQPSGVSAIKSNRQRFGALNLHVIEGEAPSALEGLPQPQVVFIGGSGSLLPEIFDTLHQRLDPGHRVVCNFATLENLQLAQSVTRVLDWQTEISQINISHSKPVGNLTRFEPLNPIYIFEGIHP